MSVDAEYPPELDRWVEQLEELEYVRSRARARGRPGDEIRPSRVTDFVLIALSSGIIGNIGYELLKAALHAWRRPAVALPQRARDMRDAVLLALLATQARCAEMDLPAPALEDLEAVACERGSGRWRVELRRVDQRRYLLSGRPWPDGVALGATVLIPDGPLHGREIEVTVVAKRDIEAAQLAERQRTQDLIERLYRSDPDP